MGLINWLFEVAAQHKEWRNELIDKKGVEQTDNAVNFSMLGECVDYVRQDIDGTIKHLEAVVLHSETSSRAQQATQSRAALGATL